MGEHLDLSSPQPNSQITRSSHGNSTKVSPFSTDYLHSECKIIHGDIKSDNIMLGIADDSVFTHFEESELQTPSPRKELDDGRIIYESRQLGMPKNFAPPVLCDFGSAVPGDVDVHLEERYPTKLLSSARGDLRDSMVIQR